MKRVIGVLLLLLSALGVVSGVPSAKAAPSDWCSDGSHTEKVLTTYPVYTGIATHSSTASPQATLCYRTDPTLPNLARGAVTARVTLTTSPAGGSELVLCEADDTSQQQVNCINYAAASTAPSLQSQGDGTYTVNVPFTVCQGASCTSSSGNLQKTGVVVGTLTPTSGTGYGAGYSLSSVAVYVNNFLVFQRAGTETAGAFVSPGLPGASVPTVSGSAPPCTLGNVCVPTFSGTLGITGANETVTIALPIVGTKSFTQSIPSKCLVNFSGSC